MPTSSTLKPARARLLLALVFGALHAWLAVSVSPRHSCAYDETAHITAGLFAWREGDLRLQPENGLLPQLWIGLPLALAPDTRLPATDQAAYRNADVWTLGDRLLHRVGNDPDRLLHQTRLMNALVGGALVFLIVLWAASLHGPAAGALAGGLAAFSPTLLAHAGLATSDSMGALGLLAATLAYWRLLHRVTISRILVAGLAAGGLALAKYSAALFPFIALVLLGARLCRRAPLPTTFGRRRGIRRVPPLLAGSFAAVLLAWGMVWAAHGFRYEAGGRAAPPDAVFNATWEKILLPSPILAEVAMADGVVPPGHSQVLRAGPVQAFVGFARDHRLLPEAWLYGFAFVERHSHFRLAYFAGEASAVGWRAFFPVAYLTKSTPAELIAHLLALAATLGALARPRTRRLAYRAAPLLAGLAIYGTFTLTTQLNIGHRHLLPVYAFAAVLAAFIPAIWRASTETSRRLLPLVLVGLVLAQIVSSSLARPSYLAYFNVLAGGPDNGHRLFADSSLDWGQDLPALRDWLAAHPASGPLYLSYFGNGAPAAYGLGDAIRIADDDFDYEPARRVAPSLDPGRYAIGATMWNRVYTQVRGPWTPGYEARYQQLRAWLSRIAASARPPDHDPDGKPMPPGRVHFFLRQFDHLRFGRLLQWLERHPADARVAHNWFIYDLDAAELDAALNGPPALSSAPATPGEKAHIRDTP